MSKNWTKTGILNIRWHFDTFWLLKHALKLGPN